VHQNYKLPVKDLRLDSTKYERMSDFHVQGIVYYFSKEDGVRISARVLEDNNEYVDNTTYEPRSADGNLRCPQAKVELSPFESFGRISTTRRNAILDNFAIQLQKDTKLKGYIV